MRTIFAHYFAILGVILISYHVLHALVDFLGNIYG